MQQYAEGTHHEPIGDLWPYEPRGFDGKVMQGRSSSGVQQVEEESPWLSFRSHRRAFTRTHRIGLVRTHLLQSAGSAPAPPVEVPFGFSPPPKTWQRPCSVPRRSSVEMPSTWRPGHIDTKPPCRDCCTEMSRVVARKDVYRDAASKRVLRAGCRRTHTCNPQCAFCELTEIGRNRRRSGVRYTIVRVRLRALECREGVRPKGLMSIARRPNGSRPTRVPVKHTVRVQPSRNRCPLSTEWRRWHL